MNDNHKDMEHPINRELPFQVSIKVSKSNLARFHKPYEYSAASFRAYVSIIIEKVLKITGIRLFQTSSGKYFLIFPYKNDKHKKRVSIVYPIDNTIRNILTDKVVEVYKKK